MLCGLFPRRIWDGMIHSDGFEAEPRGWWLEEVAPRHGVLVSVSEVASPCPTGRDVYLRRVEGVRAGDTTALTLGRLVHEAFLLPFRLREGFLKAREELLRRLRELGLGDDGVGVYLSVLEEGYVRYRVALEEAVPVLAEPSLPGDALGLTKVKPDLLAGNIPVEIVLAGAGNGWLWRKKLALAGYALAVEAWLRSPVNYGVIAAIKMHENRAIFDWRLVSIDSGLRRTFLERRDVVASIIASRDDPGVAENCPRSCPFWGICHGQARGG